MIEGGAGVIEAAFGGAAAIARRLEDVAARAGAAVVADVGRLVAEAPADALDGSTIPAATVAELVARHRLADARELALLALPVAAAMSRPPISGYRVAAIGIDAQGDLLLGANLEFPGAELGATVHAEGFVALRARRRGRSLATLVVREAHPCAHCRQTLAEMADAESLVLVDLLGNELSLEELYPWSFQPVALDHTGDTPGAVPWPDLALDPPAATELGSEVTTELLAAGSRAHAPYSAAPSAVVLVLADGARHSAGCVESVAFNPSISALQAALVEIVAARGAPSRIAAAYLGRTAGGPVDPAPGFRALLRAVAPDANATVVDWRLGR